MAGLLGWLVPGAGHWYLGLRGFALVFFLAISLPYFVGLAIGGVMTSVNPQRNVWLFAAEMGIGGYTTPLMLIGQRVDAQVTARQRAGEPVDLTRYISYYPESDVAQIYLATAGLLNLLAIIDAISRAQLGEPTFHRELLAAEQERAP